jgi:hypothetical protein
MYSGTIIDELIATVARAEQHKPAEPVYIQPIVINGGVTWGFVYDTAQVDQRYLGVA